MSRIFFHAYADIIESIIAGGIGIRVFLRFTARRSFNGAISNQQHPIVLRESNKKRGRNKKHSVRACPFKETCIKTEYSRIKMGRDKMSNKKRKTFRDIPVIMRVVTR